MLLRQRQKGTFYVCAPAPPLVTPPEPVSSRPDAAPAPDTADLDGLRGGLRILALRALGNTEAAEEAVQETLARAVGALREGRLSDRTKLAAYVAGIARHVFSHARRDEKKTVSLDDLPAASGPAVFADPLESLITAAETERLRRAFRSLSATDQRLLRLCYYEDRTPAEAAAALGQPAERVRKRKSRALERLRRAFLGETAGHESDAFATDDLTASDAQGGEGGENRDGSAR